MRWSLAIGVGVVGIVAFLALSPRRVIVAGKEIGDGDVIQMPMLEIREIPRFVVPWHALHPDRWPAGRLANHRIPKGQVLTAGDIFDGTAPVASESLLERILSPLLPVDTPPPAIAVSSPAIWNGPSEITIAFDPSQAPAVTAGLFVDLFDGEEPVTSQAQVLSVVTRTDGRISVTLQAYAPVGRLERFSNLRFEVSGAPPRTPTPRPTAWRSHETGH